MINVREYGNYMQEAEAKENYTPYGSLAIAYAAKSSDSVCFKTTNYVHLNEIMCFNKIPAETKAYYMRKMENFHKYRTIVRYNGAGEINVDWINSCDLHILNTKIVPQLVKDIEDFKNNKQPSDLCTKIPKYWRKNGKVHGEIAKLMFNLNREIFYGKHTTRSIINFDLLAMNQKLHGMLTKMRQCVNKALEESKRNRISQAVCPLKAVTNPSALPVDYFPPPDEFVDFNRFIEKLKVPPKTNIRFKRGTIGSDGRYDMCKQGIRNAYKESCHSVIQSDAIKHYLLGNNLIAEGEKAEERVQCLSKLILQRPDMVTWFLAGNSLDKETIKPVAHALERSKSKYIWLKMNPIKTGAFYVGKLVANNANIELIDLFNTGLCTDGLHHFLKGLQQGNQTQLKHLYLSINNLGAESVCDMVQILNLLPKLESLYIGSNNWGDAGLKAISERVKGLSNLERLIVGSSDLTDASLDTLKDVVDHCPKLVSVDIGSYRSSNYFSNKHNVFTDKDKMIALGNSILKNAAQLQKPKYQYLGYQNTFDTPYADDLVQTLFRKGLNVNGLHYKVRKNRALLHISNLELRKLEHPLSVMYIESIYRNAM